MRILILLDRSPLVKAIYDYQTAFLPDGIFKRTIRGMLPYKKDRGRKAFKRLRVWVGLPDEFKKSELIKLKEADASKLKTKSIALGELSFQLGGKKRW